MPPPAVKTVRDLIYWQYAAIMTGAATGRKNEWALRMSFLNKLKGGEIVWSTSVREWLLEMENPNVCIYCGSSETLTTEHILPRSRGGEDVTDNVVRVCKACNSGKGAKGLYEWKGLQEKNNHHRIAEGKYLILICDGNNENKNRGCFSSRKADDAGGLPARQGG
ncbi:HNH endonuclease [Papillibacter cinnamivorans]|uniref:HNH endonuclease n=1 Tax=Papillibacter cinnamivorans DSM 12816 TaxID=1122930 RepID=A0A1W1YWP9_9FIRM|nr:HNH endonuclease [Papillibacter cinnamivorans]SMC40502.1 HNH endonuclease [Papillibacter cinnamivorans DSM 12816]